MTTKAPFTCTVIVKFTLTDRTGSEPNPNLMGLNVLYLNAIHVQNSTIIICFWMISLQKIPQILLLYEYKCEDTVSLLVMVIPASGTLARLSGRFTWSPAQEMYTFDLPYLSLLVMVIPASGTLGRLSGRFTWSPAHEMCALQYFLM